MLLFLLLLRIPISIGSSAVGLKICAITAGIKCISQQLRKERIKHDKIISFAKTELNVIEVLISKALIVSLKVKSLKY